MDTLISTLAGLRRDRRAVTALEYGLIAAVIVTVGLLGFGTIGESLASKVTQVETTLGT